MKKIIILSVLLALSLFMFNCGGGSGSSSSPKGENPGEPSIVQLLPAQFVAQTNSIITLHAKVLDGNGAPVNNIPVSFTNLSPIGVLNATTAQTNNTGIATVTLKSTASGFATVQAEVNKGVSSVRDRKSLYFTTAIVIYPTLSTSIDGDGDRVFNESDDFVMIANGRDTSTLKAILLDATGMPLAGRTILFSTDTTYIDCTVAKTACNTLSQPFHEEVLFPNGRYAQTNYEGEATLEITVSSNIKEFRTSFNVAAQDTISGASDLFTVFLKPITVGTVTVRANLPVVEPFETATVTACAYSTAPDLFNVGVPVPDGTIISFNATAGVITRFVQAGPLQDPLTNQEIHGCAIAGYTAPLTEGDVIITATAGGKSGQVILTVVAPPPPPPALTVLPSAQPVNGITGGTATFRIFGGVATYNVLSSNPAIACNSADTDCTDATDTGFWTVNTSGDTFKVTIPAGSAAGTVTITVRDSAGSTTTVKLDITAEEPSELGITPTSATVTGINNPDGDPSDDVTFVITGGVSPYSVTSSLPGVISSPGNLGAGVNIFTVDSQAVSSVTNVTLTILDSAGSTVTATVTVNPVFLSISLDRINVIGLANPDSNTADDITFTVTGGIGPYVVTSSNPALTPEGAWTNSAAPFSFLFDPNNVGTTTTITLTVYDNVGATAVATLAIFPVATGLVISVDKPDVIGLLNPDGNTTDDIIFTVTGGTPPYIVSAAGDNNFFTPIGPWALLTSGSTRVIDPGSSSSKTVTLTVTDNVGALASTTVNIHP